MSAFLSALAFSGLLACGAASPGERGASPQVGGGEASRRESGHPPGAATSMAVPSHNELQTLARGLRNEALQVRRAKELAEFSMEPDTHAVALRAQSPEVTTAQAADLVGMEVQRYRDARSAVVALLATGRDVQPSGTPDRAGTTGLSDVAAAWSEYLAAVGQDGGSAAGNGLAVETPAR